MTGFDRLTKASVINEAALDRKAQRVVGLDVREVSSFADTFIVATGTSDRHLRSIADSISSMLSKRDARPLGVEGYQEGRWILIDCDDVIVHLFQPELRDYYDLERLWSDAPLLELEPATQKVAP
jgi:ribosome-associated protein